MLFRSLNDAELGQCESVGRVKEFEISSKFRYSSLAQSVERVTVNHDVVGSSPTGGAIKSTSTYRTSRFLLITFSLFTLHLNFYPDFFF